MAVRRLFLNQSSNVHRRLPCRPTHQAACVLLQPVGGHSPAPLNPWQWHSRHPPPLRSASRRLDRVTRCGREVLHTVAGLQVRGDQEHTHVRHDPVERTQTRYRQESPEEKEEQEQKQEDEVPSVDLSALSEALRHRIQAMGVMELTAVQSIAFPALCGPTKAPLTEAVLLQSPTGTGKTLAFLMPIVQELNLIGLVDQVKAGAAVHHVGLQALIVVPSEILAAQMQQVIRSLLGLHDVLPAVSDQVVMNVVGSQQRAHSDFAGPLLRNRPPIVVGTPKALLAAFRVETQTSTSRTRGGGTQGKAGRRDDFFGAVPNERVGTNMTTGGRLGRRYGLSTVRFLVLDEADKTLKPLKKYATLKQKTLRESKPTAAQLITRHVLAHCLTARLVVVSATLTGRLRTLIHHEGWQKSPRVLGGTSPMLLLPPTIKHCVMWATEREKPDVLVTLIESLKPSACMAILPPGTSSGGVAKAFKAKGIAACSLHEHIQGDAKSFERFVELFEQGRWQVVFATEDEVRGLDFPFVSHVFLTSVPIDSQVYLHMAGRTARFGRTGVVVTLCAPEEEVHWEKICKHTLIDVTDIVDTWAIKERPSAAQD